MRRRLIFLCGAALFAALLAAAGWSVLAAGGWSRWEVGIAALFALNLPWLALAGATGVAGFAVTAFAPEPAPLLVPGLDHPAAPEPPTLLGVCLRSEALDELLPAMEALLRALGGPHAVALISDTPDGPDGAREDAAVAALRARLPPGRLLHRRRRENVGWKAGNLLDFLDRHAEGFELLLVLDADSRMDARLVRRMIRAMGANRRLGLLQATVEGRPGRTRFARLLGLGHAPGGQCWAVGQAWWQGGHGAFWGHNAVLRIAPFRRHCRLEALPDGAHVLSHDFVEAARLHRAGWEVRVLPARGQSFEAHPPDLPAFLGRDRRWAAGNLQYRHLLRDGRLSRLGRFQMAQAMAHYLVGPAWFLLLPLGAANAATGGAEGTPRLALLGWMAACYASLHASRLLGHVRNGTPLRDVVRESLFLVPFEAVMALDKTLTVLAHALGRRRPAWPAQRREGRGVGWREASRLLWPQALAGAAALGLLLLSGSWFAVAVGLPAAAGLLLAVPFCVWTARP